jgi:hypothetical protein
MKLIVSEMFDDLIRQGYITPEIDPCDLTLPGAYADVPSVMTYGTPNVPVQMGVHSNAELEQHTSRNFGLPS